MTLEYVKAIGLPSEGRVEEEMSDGTKVVLTVELIELQQRRRTVKKK